MWYRANWNRTLWSVGLALACGVGLSLGIASGPAWGQAACRPTTPCPCSADGVCRPKRDSWGHYETKWRPWPGDKVSGGPTPADDAEARDKLEEELKAFQRPDAEHEDLRGAPEKDAQGDSDLEEPAAEALPAEGDQGSATPIPLRLPAARNVAQRSEDLPQPLPAVSPAQQPATSRVKDDAPPQLPASLKRMAAARGLAPAPATPAPAIPNRGPNTGVVHTGWQQPTGIRLINPAAALVPEATGDQLRQAIYYESTDQKATDSSR